MVMRKMIKVVDLIFEFGDEENKNKLLVILENILHENVLKEKIKVQVYPNSRCIKIRRK